jgi:hypothetical protein
MPVALLLSHRALRAATAEVFWDVRERIYREGASDGQVTDLGPLLSAFTDPDGLWGEVCWDRPPQAVRSTGEASSWRHIAYLDRA